MGIYMEYILVIYLAIRSPMLLTSHMNWLLSMKSLLYLYNPLCGWMLIDLDIAVEQVIVMLLDLVRVRSLFEVLSIIKLQNKIQELRKSRGLTTYGIESRILKANDCLIIIGIHHGLCRNWVQAISYFEVLPVTTKYTKSRISYKFTTSVIQNRIWKANDYLSRIGIRHVLGGDLVLLTFVWEVLFVEKFY